METWILDLDSATQISKGTLRLNVAPQQNGRRRLTHFSSYQNYKMDDVILQLLSLLWDRGQKPSSSCGGTC